MITTQSHGRHPGVLIVEFGTGDIMFTRTYFEDAKASGLMFSQHSVPHKIGETTDEYNGKTSDDLPDAKLIISFTKPASVAALIHSLIEVQKDMFDKQMIDNQ